MPETEPEYFLVYSWKNGDKVVFLIGQSSSEGTFFEQKVIEPQAGKYYSFPPYPDIKLETVGQTGKWQALSEYSAIPVKPSISQKILIQAEAGYKKDQKYLEAALKAVARFTHTDIQINPVDSTGGYDWIFHLSENVPTPEMQDQARNLLVFEAGLPGADLIFQSGRHYILSQHLNPDNFTEIPSQLLSLLFASEVKKLNFPENIGITLEQRNSVPIIEEKKTKTTTAMSRPLHFWVWTVLLLLFLTERIYRPKND